MPAKIAVTPTSLNLKFAATGGVVESSAAISNQTDKDLDLDSLPDATFAGSPTDPILVGIYGGFGVHPIAKPLSVPVTSAELESDPVLPAGATRNVTLAFHAPSNWNPDLSYVGEWKLEDATLALALAPA